MSVRRSRVDEFSGCLMCQNPDKISNARVRPFADKLSNILFSRFDREMYGVCCGLCHGFEFRDCRMSSFVHKDDSESVSRIDSLVRRVAGRHARLRGKAGDIVP